MMAPEMASDSQQRIWFAVFVLVVFCTGMASGILIGRRMMPESLAGIGPPLVAPGIFVPPSGRAGQPALIVDRLTEILALSPDQREHLEDILSGSRKRATAAQHDVRTRFEIEQRTLRDEIRQILTPDQQVRFEQWIEQGSRSRGFGRGLIERLPD
jgi:hypothetical protein